MHDIISNTIFYSGAFFLSIIAIIGIVVSVDALGGWIDKIILWTKADEQNTKENPPSEPTPIITKDDVGETFILSDGEPIKILEEFAHGSIFLASGGCAYTQSGNFIGFWHNVNSPFSKTYELTIHEGFYRNPKIQRKV